MPEEKGSNTFSCAFGMGSVSSLCDSRFLNRVVRWDSLKPQKIIPFLPFFFCGGEARMKVSCTDSQICAICSLFHVF